MSAVASIAPSIEIFFSYAHEDEARRRELDKHLSLIWRRGIARKWHDRQIGPGTEWSGQIDVHLNSAQIILLLISNDFLASRYCYDIEMTRAMERHRDGDARVIPILLRHCDWHDAPFGKLSWLPKNGTPVAAWPDQDEAFTTIAREIAAVVDELLDGRDDAPSADVQPDRRRRGIRSWWISGGAAILAALALIVAGVRTQLFPREPVVRSPVATPAVLTNDENLQTKRAFAVGASVAMAGRSSGDTGTVIFDQTLAELGLRGAQAQDLERRYAQIEASAGGGTWTNTRLEIAQSELLATVSQRVEASGGLRPAAALTFGYDVSALLLLLKIWPETEQDEMLALAKTRIASLQSAVRGVEVPPSVAQRIAGLRANDLRDADTRQETKRILDRAFQQFAMPAR